ncbi:E3 ubiquitin-protein ligase NEURL1-like [Spea bombifrons]|uniref:E3 ubiquitin-protein ligase NEURL1-like n=1 Tax=Spea bombifrons TaxID=233779 RepID=UPI002349DC52|nr:E3 ubiquitin-protein ligase NEURL1-like [Spea bombifrons]
MASGSCDSFLLGPQKGVEAGESCSMVCLSHSKFQPMCLLRLLYIRSLPKLAILQMPIEPLVDSFTRSPDPLLAMCYIHDHNNMECGFEKLRVGTGAMITRTPYRRDALGGLALEHRGFQIVRANLKKAREISFHPVVKGHHISLDGCMHRAERYKSFNHGLLFSNRPLYYQEKIWVKVIEDEPHWHGALRLGFTSVDPDTIDPSRLPPFSCPDLNRRNGFWAVAVPEDLCYQNNLISFWVNKKGQALYQAMGDSCPTVLFSGLPRNGLLWAMIDVYGQTKAIQLLSKWKHSEGHHPKVFCVI